ncbi:hypothetical protein ACF1FC_33610, partial [Streptomyces sp. NPDC014344]|uniref:hypothetical protein n=1 Tax=Streptomyces sp. NPDC014344 TaxID=3364871 RepID=UPI0036F54609
MIKTSTITFRQLILHPSELTEVELAASPFLLKGCQAGSVIACSEPFSSCAGGWNGLVSGRGDGAGPLVVGVV